ncbi:hypothetical protein WN944_019013 [Citrus x changshan-huyou]|uniref:Uncharacterized protein n=1 Tax=Citrus x changshan-huyou TaxID=2935761 RepID=A0AAP0LXU3_9ROSI
MVSNRRKKRKREEVNRIEIGLECTHKRFFPDCSEVALKRFKNCSAAGDTNFKHEARLLLALGMPILLIDEVKIVRLFKSTERFCANAVVKDVMPTRVNY